MSSNQFKDIRLKAQRGMLFETPIVTAQINKDATFISALRKTILEKKSQSPKGIQRSNIGGWHSDTDMLEWGGPAAQELVDRVITLSKKMSHFADTDIEAVKWKTQMWANVSEHGDFNQPHVHPGNIWSAVFYVDMGSETTQTGSSKSVGGEFYFEDPRFPMNSMLHPGFKMIGMDNKPQSVQPELHPNNGDILLFPSWLRHGVRPYTGTKQRISIAINLDVL